MREIQLTQGYVALIDDEDYDKVSAFKWHIKKGRNTIYAKTNVRISNETHPEWYAYKSCVLHRFVMNVIDREVQVDHRDRNGLNCQKYNLRLATSRQNNANRGLSSKNTSGFKGVTRNFDKWQAQIQIGDDVYVLGRFADKIEAAAAYDMAAIKYFGDFAYLNLKLKK